LKGPKTPFDKLRASGRPEKDWGRNPLNAELVEAWAGFSTFVLAFGAARAHENRRDIG
jgi:hypothetical protein